MCSVNNLLMGNIIMPFLASIFGIFIFSYIFSTMCIGNEMILALNKGPLILRHYDVIESKSWRSDICEAIFFSFSW